MVDLAVECVELHRVGWQQCVQVVVGQTRVELEELPLVLSIDDVVQWSSQVHEVRELPVHRLPGYRCALGRRGVTRHVSLPVRYTLVYQERRRGRTDTLSGPDFTALLTFLWVPVHDR